jgi:hypothetical protein
MIPNLSVTGLQGCSCSVFKIMSQDISIPQEKGSGTKADEDILQLSQIRLTKMNKQTLYMWRSQRRRHKDPRRTKKKRQLRCSVSGENRIYCCHTFSSLSAGNSTHYSCAGLDEDNSWRIHLCFISRHHGKVISIIEPVSLYYKFLVEITSCIYKVVCSATKMFSKLLYLRSKTGQFHFLKNKQMHLKPLHVLKI